ncbi:AAA family ATPase [Fusobacterium animalis]
MKKGIGIGIEDFREIIKEDCYYFDKTNYIEELIKDKTKIKLFPLCTTKNSSIG